MSDRDCWYSYWFVTVMCVRVNYRDSPSDESVQTFPVKIMNRDKFDWAAVRRELDKHPEYKYHYLAAVRVQESDVVFPYSKGLIEL